MEFKQEIARGLLSIEAVFLRPEELEPRYR